MDYYIYIDESGDPGTKQGSSNNFIIAAIVLTGQENREKLKEALISLRKKLGWNDNKELKFHQSSKDIIRLTIHSTKNCDYEAYAVVLSKEKIISGEIQIPKRNFISLFVIEELLKKLALSNATIIIDGAYGRKYITKARTYLRQQLKSARIYNNTIHFVDSKKEPLIQLADILAGSVAKSLPNNTDNNDEFIKLFNEKIKKIYKL